MAYDRWPHNLIDEETLQRRVDLNHERAEEESRGIIRWVRPEFHNAADPQATFVEVADDYAARQEDRLAEIASRSNSLPDRIRAVRSELEAICVPVASKEIASRLVRVWQKLPSARSLTRWWQSARRGSWTTDVMRFEVKQTPGDGGG